MNTQLNITGVILSADQDAFRRMLESELGVLKKLIDIKFFSNRSPTGAPIISGRIPAVQMPLMAQAVRNVFGAHCGTLLEEIPERLAVPFPAS